MQALFAILQLLPLILNAVVTVESAFGKGQGAAKKGLIMGAIAPVAEAAHGVKETADVLVPAISQTIDGVVNVLNATGAWPKGIDGLRTAQRAFSAAQGLITAVDAAFPRSAD